MKFIEIIPSIFVLLLFLPLTIKAQHLDVEGDVKIRGSIDINHELDSTSIYIGLNAGDQIPLDSEPHHNTFVGSKAGQLTTSAFSTFVGAEAGELCTGLSNSFFGVKAGRSTTGRFNSFVGAAAGINNLSGERNSFFGDQSGALNTLGVFNTFVGSNAGFTNRVGSRNTFIGGEANAQNQTDTLDSAIAIGYNAKVGCSNCAVIGGTGTDAVKVGIGIINPERVLDVRGDTRIRGFMDLHPEEDSTSIFIGKNVGQNATFSFQSHNTMVGKDAGMLLTSSSDNSFFGSNAGKNTTAEANTFLGSDAGYSNTSGFENSFTGYQAGYDNMGGQRNSFFGFQAGRRNESGSSNTFVGQQSGFFTKSGSSNASLGALTGRNNISGSRNTFIGSRADLDGGLDSLDRAVAIGYNAKVGCSNCAVIGGTGADSVKVGIGVTNPTEVLDINGGIRIRKVDILPAFNDATPLYIYADGTLARGNFSDQRLKENLKPLEQVLAKIDQIKGYNYSFKSDPKHHQEIGVIAQEIEAVFPELVFIDHQSGMKGVHYDKFTAVLIEATKEQQVLLRQQAKKITAIEKELLALRNLYAAFLANSEK